MEYEVTFKVKIDSDNFILDLNQSDREDIVKDEILGVLYDLEDGEVLYMDITEVDG